MKRKETESLEPRCPTKLNRTNQKLLSNDLLLSEVLAVMTCAQQGQVDLQRRFKEAAIKHLLIFWRVEM